MPGVRAELAVHDPPNCPLVDLSGSEGAEVDDIQWTRSAGGDRVEEFRLADGTDPPDGVTPVFESDRGGVYQLSRPESVPACACEVVERAGVPVTDARVRDGTLLLTLHLSDASELRELVNELGETVGSVSVRCLLHDDDRASADLRVADLGRLTDRQAEVLSTAHGMGYFAYPREANATEVAEALDIQPSTFTEHLAAAQAKLYDELLEG